MTRAVGVLLVLIATVLAIVVVSVVLLLATGSSHTVSPSPSAISAAPAASTPSPLAMPAATLQAKDEPPPHAVTATATVPATQLSPSPPPTQSLGPPAWTQMGNKNGLHLLLDDDRGHWPQQAWPQHVQVARQFVGEGGYVVQLIRLDDLNVPRWQFFLDLCAREHLIPIIRLAPAYDHDQKWWKAPPKDANGQGYTAIARQCRHFFGQLRWPVPQRYVIVGNEPNRGDEWANHPDPAEYARYLLDISAALHEVGVTILGPALDLYAPHTNGQILFGHRYIDAETFLDEMAAAHPRVFEAIDVWASHAYPLDPFRFDPSRQTFQIDYAFGATNPHHAEPPDGIHNRGINSYRWELWKVEQYLGPRAATIPVMITESGWRHAPSQDTESTDSVHAQVSFETMSAYLDLALHGNHGRYPHLPETGWTPWNDDPRVMGVVFFALGGLPSVWGHTNWVTLDNGGNITSLYPLTLQR
jgi:hypothetical protein